MAAIALLQMVRGVEMVLNVLAGKRGMMGAMGGPRKPISLVLGLAFLAFGIIPLLNHLGKISFSLPPIPQAVLYVLSVVGAVFLLWDAVSENTAMMGFPQMLRMATFVMALVLLAVGLVPLLHSIGKIAFDLPPIIGIIADVLYIATGGLLMYGGTQGF